MRQFNDIKSKYPDALLLFRVGDFYETFGDDAIKASKILNIVLTNRSNGSSKIELAGFPFHAIDTYLPKLVNAGERVAICDQLEDPKKTKKIVKRGVTELVTPGVSYRDNHIDQRSNNFLCSIYFTSKNIGIAFLDNSTGEFLVGEGYLSDINKLIESFHPSEIIFQKNQKKKFAELSHNNLCTYMMDEWVFNEDYANDILTEQFGTESIKGFGIEHLKSGMIAAGSCLHYLKETHHNLTKHISSISRIEKEKYVWMDKFTIENLELLYSRNEQAKTLLNILDKTLSPMGSRMMKKWIALPSKIEKEILSRSNIVDHLIKSKNLIDIMQENIKKIGDLERLISKVSTSRISPRECNQLKLSLSCLIPIKDICEKSKSKDLKNLGKIIDPCKAAINKISSQISEEPPATTYKPGFIKSGFNKKLDELRLISKCSKDYLNEILEKESKKTLIPSLKISFNNVFGYYLEVRNIHKEKVPKEWIRKQTLVNAERYITEELKDYEKKIISAEDQIISIENEIYHKLIEDLCLFLKRIQTSAHIIAKLDCLYSFAYIAKQNNYTKPVITEKKSIIIKNGRHPVIEQNLSSDNPYIPNDIVLNQEDQQIIMITGPNMSGKSAILRQTALITIMSQIGSFVPADSAKIGIVDKIFTRVGGSDNISIGESTFMVEMNETASILNNLSERSLILMDEIGRGTSTYDGISIAWAIAEYIHENKYKPKTLFATHYHELNEMTNTFKRIKNFNVAVKEINDKIIFIRKLKEGGSKHSFGINVAKISGMPTEIITRSRMMLKKLQDSRRKTKNNTTHQDMQLSFFQMENPDLNRIINDLEEIDINKLTPVEALIKLQEFKKNIGK